MRIDMVLTIWTGTVSSRGNVSQVYVLSAVFWLVKRHVIEKQEIGFTKGSKCDVENVVSPSLDSTPAAVLPVHKLEIRLSMLLQVVGLLLHVHLTETFLGLGLTVTEQKKFRNKTLKALKM